MSALLAVGAVNAALLAILVARSRQPSRADGWLRGILFSIAGAYSCAFLAVKTGEDAWLLPLVYSNLLIGPLTYSYVREMTVAAAGQGRNWPVFFAPALLAYGYLIWMLLTRSGADLDVALSNRHLWERPPLAVAWYLIDLLSVPAVLIAVHRRIVAHDRWVREHFSYRARVDLEWMRRLAIALFGLWVLIDLPLFGALWTAAPSDQRVLGFGMSVGTLLVLYLGYHGARQLHVGADFSESDRNETPRYERSGMSDEELVRYRERLLDVMQSERPYLDRSLDLATLAGRVGLSPHNLSEVINVALGESFYDFVNGHRVAEFCRRATAEELTRRTILDLALDCGFNSKSSFNRIFKARMGSTPSQYLKSRAADG